MLNAARYTSFNSFHNSNLTIKQKEKNIFLLSNKGSCYFQLKNIVHGEQHWHISEDLS